MSNTRSRTHGVLLRATLLALLVGTASVGYMAAVDAGVPHQHAITKQIVAALGAIPGIPEVLDDARWYVRGRYTAGLSDGSVVGGPRVVVLLAAVVPLVVIVFFIVRFSDR